MHMLDRQSHMKLGYFYLFLEMIIILAVLNVLLADILEPRHADVVTVKWRQNAVVLHTRLQLSPVCSARAPRPGSKQGKVVIQESLGQTLMYFSVCRSRCQDIVGPL